LGLLFVFKYLGFTMRIFGLPAPSIALPIGISFFTFQAMSYVIDVYRRRAAAERDILNVALYISFFPQLVAGPIVRYNTIAGQIARRRVTWEKFGQGAQRFMAGFCKKVLLANNLALIAEPAFAAAPEERSLALAWLGAVGYSLQLYYDFSGYSDMAIGLGRMFGFTFEENFNYPYLSKTCTEFWRRWHISLGQWFRDYVYIPLGGSRAGTPRCVFNLFAVWALTGIWHGANYTFIAWGLLFFALLCAEKWIFRPQGWTNPAAVFLWRVLTLFCVVCSWVLFNSPTLSSALAYCAGLIGIGVNGLLGVTARRLLREHGVFFLAGLLFSVPVARRLPRAAAFFLQAAAFLWAVSFVVLGSHNPFIYFNF